ncbi:MAG: hypothetical protein JWQ23_298, partial [Herminiimonas sp.]|nr:hypothetical protein [Herminiimonas sp.]
MLVRPIAWLILAIASALQSPAALADTYPAKPIRMVVPWTPGSGADIVGRQIAQKLSEILNQTVFVENRGGASGTIGSAIAARDAPDGYTLILGNSASHGSAK